MKKNMKNVLAGLIAVGVVAILIMQVSINAEMRRVDNVQNRSLALLREDLDTAVDVIFELEDQIDSLKEEVEELKKEDLVIANWECSAVETSDGYDDVISCDIVVGEESYYVEVVYHEYNGVIDVYYDGELVENELEKELILNLVADVKLAAY